MNIEIESEKWEHPYRIQVTKLLRWDEIIPFIRRNACPGSYYAIERRRDFFVLWREPEQEWDVDEASLEWIDEWTLQEPPLLENIISEFKFDPEKDEEIMPKTENRIRRDDAIRAEFAYLKKQGFQSGHLYRVLAEKFYLSPHRVRDIVTLTREKMP